jgi:hypothetical protein
MYRLGPDVSTGFCGLHYVRAHGKSMAIKARFFIVKVRDGHGTSVVTCPAQSADDIRNRFPLSPHQKIESIDHEGWCEVNAVPDTDLYEPAFAVIVQGKSVLISRGMPGYGYLTLLFPKQVHSINNYFNEQRNSEL